MGDENSESECIQSYDIDSDQTYQVFLSTQDAKRCESGMDLFEDKIFNNDVLYIKSLIGKSVKITTTDDKSVSGIVYVIDPIYKTVVLHSKAPNTENNSTIFVIYHAIKSLEVLYEGIHDGYLEESIPNKLDQNETSREKIKLKKWLQERFINVDEVGEYLKIDDHLIIMPPYGLDNCISNNTIVLERIRKIIGLMPKDFG